MKTVLIAGGAGFIGSHLCDLFLSKNYKVVCMDNLITGRLKNIRHLKSNKYFKFVKHDISRSLHFGGKIDMVLDFASPASPVDYLKYPIQTLEVGSFGTCNCLRLAEAKKARFLLASTSEVYGDPQIHPQKEDYWGNVNPVGIRSVYDEAKRFSEAITMAYHRVYGLDTKIVRIFNTYGPRMKLNDGRVVPNFIAQALKNKPLTIYGDGSQTRSFCYVSDLIEGIYKCAHSDTSSPVNLGNPKEFTILEFAELIIQLTHSKSRLEFKALPKDDPKKRKPDITRAKNQLKWFPEISVQEGLKVTIEYFKTYRIK